LVTPVATLVVVGLVPWVWTAPVGKSGSFTLINETVEPVGTSTDQSPLASVSTIISLPKEVVTVTSTFGIFGSPISWAELPLVS